MTAYIKEQLAEQLKTGVYEVIFEKKDGTTRVMKCSLKEEVIKPLVEARAKLLKEGAEVKTRAPNPNVLSVVDIEKNEWRSFRLDSIKEVNKLD